MLQKDHVAHICTIHLNEPESVSEILKKSKDSPLSPTEVKLQSSLVRRSLSNSGTPGRNLQVNTGGQVKQIIRKKFVEPILKKDGSVRLCGDYKITVNKATETETYPLPVIQGCVWCYLAHTYQQVQLDEKSQKMATVTSHKSLFKVNR